MAFSGGVICPHLSNSQHQDEVFTAVVFQAGQGLRGGTGWHLCFGTDPVAAPALAPAAHERQMGSCLLAPHSCNSAPAADLISCLGFAPSASPVGGGGELSCTRVLIPTCLCVLSLGIREQQRLLCPSGRGYHWVSQKGKVRLMSDGAPASPSSAETPRLEDFSGSQCQTWLWSALRDKCVSCGSSLYGSKGSY